MSGPLRLTAIPHRPPFLFVDEIIEVTDGRIVTRTFVDPEADFFKGHYPDQPVMPGVLTCEAAFQSGALLIAHRIGGLAADTAKVPVVTRISDARFKRIVVPGETLDIEVIVDDELDGCYYMTGRVRVGGKLATRVTFAAMMASPPHLASSSDP
jgi:3-hydroxyacyl-[acyl-carrier-protein] dehydratase